MAIPASGSISLSTIQSEWGGSNPISMSEYYSGSLASNNNPDTEYPNVSYSSTSIYYPATPGSKGVPGTPAYTGYYRQFGFVNSNIYNSAAYPAIGAASQGFTTTTGIDKTGNAGAIPSSGTIQFNHFRGTNGSGTNTTVTLYGIRGVQSKTDNNAWSNITVQFFVGGTFGTNFQTGNNWTGVPFRYIDVNALSGFPATRFYGSDNHQNSGWVTSKGQLYQITYPNIGAVTRLQYPTNNNTNINMAGAWTVSVTT